MLLMKWVFLFAFKTGFAKRTTTLALSKWQIGIHRLWMHNETSTKRTTFLYTIIIILDNLFYRMRYLKWRITYCNNIFINDSPVPTKSHSLRFNSFITTDIKRQTNRAIILHEIFISRSWCFHIIADLCSDMLLCSTNQCIYVLHIGLSCTCHGYSERVLELQGAASHFGWKYGHQRATFRPP